MYIDPTLFTLGMLSISGNTHSRSRTSYEATPKMDERKLAEEIVKAQAKQEEEKRRIEEEVKETLKNDIEYQLTLYARGRSRREQDETKVQNLFHLLKREKPSLVTHSSYFSRFRIYSPDAEHSDYYVKIYPSNHSIEAYIFQIYMEFFASPCAGNRKFWRENINGDIYFIIKNEFAEELGWI